jgi:hypothetical protein
MDGYQIECGFMFDRGSYAAFAFSGPFWWQIEKGAETQ